MCFSVSTVCYGIQWKFKYAAHAEHGVAQDNLAQYYQSHGVTEACKAMGLGCGGLARALCATASADRKCGAPNFFEKAAP